MCVCDRTHDINDCLAVYKRPRADSTLKQRSHMSSWRISKGLTRTPQGLGGVIEHAEPHPR